MTSRTDRSAPVDFRRVNADAKAAVSRLLSMVASGRMDEGDPEFRERVTAQKLRRDETARQIEEMRRQLASGAPTITPEKIERVARLLKDKLHNGPPDLRQAYPRLMIDEVRVTKEEICISGSNSVLARAASEGVDVPALAVLSLCSELARPTRFERVTFAFGGHFLEFVAGC